MARDLSFTFYLSRISIRKQMFLHDLFKYVHRKVHMHARGV